MRGLQSERSGDLLGRGLDGRIDDASVLILGVDAANLPGPPQVVVYLSADGTVVNAWVPDSELIPVPR